MKLLYFLIIFISTSFVSTSNHIEDNNDFLADLLKFSKTHLHQLPKSPPNVGPSIIQNESKEQKNYEELENAIHHYDETESESALIVIDTEKEDEHKKENTKRSSITSEKTINDFDQGFTIIIDREDLGEEAIQKDEIYEEMEKSYGQVQEKFKKEIREPIKQKHVRVIVITPQQQNNSTSTFEQETSQPQSELDLDIAKLQKVRDKMTKLDVPAIAPPSTKRKKLASSHSNGKNKTNPIKVKTTSQHNQTSFNHQNKPSSGKGFKARKGSSTTKNHEQAIDHNLSTSVNKLETNDQSVIIKLPHNNKKHIQSPPVNPHPIQNIIEEHYRKKVTQSRTGEKKSTSNNKELPVKNNNNNNNNNKNEEDDLITMIPHIPYNFKLNGSVEDPSDDNLVNPSTNIMAQEENNIKTDNTSSNKHPVEEGGNLMETNKTSFDNSKIQASKESTSTIQTSDHEAQGNNTISMANFDERNQNSTKPESSISKTTNETKTDRFKVIDTEKAEAIIQYLNKDPLESWRYPYKTLKMLDLDAGLIRSGLVYPGYIERLKGVMKRAISGKDIMLSIVGGSISAGGGLYKDQGSIEGLYYKGVVDWWNQWIFPVTGSRMKVNNAAVGSIGTDYFSYCVNNHLKANTDLVIWELSGNDYNRYKTFPTKGARPLERFTRMILDLPSKPALLYLNFFKGIDYKNSKTDCPNFEDQQEHTIASYYHVPTLSWRAMVCNGLVNSKPGFLMSDLFSIDQYHPSIKGHAQSALLILLHLRHVMRAVLQYAIKNDGSIANFDDQYNLPDPLFIGPKHPQPYCWTLIRPDEKDPVHNSLEVSVAMNDGFHIQYATNFPIRFDKVMCYKSDKTDTPTSSLRLVFTIPKTLENKDKRFEVVITTHSKWGGSAMIWIDDKNDEPVFIQEGRPGDPGRRTQVDTVASGLIAGTHFINLWSKDGGFCLAALMIDVT